MTSNYTFWCHHGEKPDESLGSWNEATDNSNNMFDMLRDLYPNMSKTNEENRALQTMNQHSGRRPVRQIALDLEEKLGRPPNVAELVFETYKEGDMIKDDAAIERHAKILEIMEANPNFTALEVVEAILGEQKCGHVICFGGGLRPKDLKSSTSTTNANDADLEAQLRRSDEEKEALQQTVTELKDTVTEQAEEMANMKAEMKKLQELFETSQNRQH
ncbi:unnamed protein product [Linum trigynum]|uniref:Uncharacterized protein n=1 Tax=Linum trigynum TaxID=586398 RepID=A0AAV2ES29_9ROSI